jgi:hypothetical protein
LILAWSARAQKCKPGMLEKGAPILFRRPMNQCALKFILSGSPLCPHEAQECLIPPFGQGGRNYRLLAELVLPVNAVYNFLIA